MLGSGAPCPSTRRDSGRLDRRRPCCWNGYLGNDGRFRPPRRRREKSPSYALLGAVMAVAYQVCQPCSHAHQNRMRDADGEFARAALRRQMGNRRRCPRHGCREPKPDPIHIAFIPLLFRRSLAMNELKMDRRMIACAITFGIVTAYMFSPSASGESSCTTFSYKNINDAGMGCLFCQPTAAMAIPRGFNGNRLRSRSSPTASRAPTAARLVLASSEDKPIDMKKVCRGGCPCRAFLCHS